MYIGDFPEAAGGEADIFDEAGAVGAWFWQKYYSELAAKRQLRPKEVEGYVELTLFIAHGAVRHEVPKGGLAVLPKLQGTATASHGTVGNGGAILLLAVGGSADHGVDGRFSAEVQFEVHGQASGAAEAAGCAELDFSVSGRVDHRRFVLRGQATLDIAGRGFLHHGVVAIVSGELNFSASGNVYHDPDENYCLILPLVA